MRYPISFFILRVLSFLVFSFFLLFLSKAKADSLYSISYRWDNQHEDARMWTAQSAESVDENILDVPPPKDIASFCPKYKGLSPLEQLQFWIYLMSSMAQLESNFKPHVKYTENFVDSSGKKVVSRGLLQLSYESAKLYKCNFSKDLELHAPDINLDCGAKIMAYWLKKDGVHWQIRNQVAWDCEILVDLPPLPC